MSLRSASLAVIAATALGSAAAHAADPVALRFASPSPPQGQVNKWGLETWIQDVTQASKGTLDIKFTPGMVLANFGNIYERTISGVVEIGFGLFGPLASEFRKTNVSSLPFEAENCAQSSVALWRLLDKGLIADEYAKVKPLALLTFPGSGIHTKKKIAAIDDLKGIKIAVFARGPAQEAHILGAAPVTMAPTEAYQAVQRGLADGMIIGMSGLVPFKYQEVVNHHLIAPLGQTNAWVFMNKEAYAALPAPARDAIDRFSYENFASRMGKVSDRMDSMFTDMVRKMPDHTVYSLDARQSEILKGRMASIAEQWIGSVPNGREILAAYRAELTKLRPAR